LLEESWGETLNPEEEGDKISDAKRHAKKYFLCRLYFYHLALSIWFLLFLMSFCHNPF